MPELKKFEETEKKIAQAENVLLENGKYVSVDFEEDDEYHLVEHEKGSKNMLTKQHIKVHMRHIEDKLRKRAEQDAVEVSMPY